uniref:LYRIC protein n=1 Tax=Neogobius melanostomus TaxID=47308 RepID=A0A8C6WF24_9GOBI
MAGDLRGFALEKAEFISRRFRELLSSGEGYIRAHFGVDLSLKAEQWVILFLFTAAVGLLMLAVSCTGVCGGLLGGKKRRSLATSEGNTESDKASLAKSTAKSEEQRKKNKKKLTEKVAQTVHEAQTTLPMKKNKKKPKLDMKPTQQLSTAEGKEQDEGAWETKVSNREKRQQRKKERGPDDSGSPGGWSEEALKSSAGWTDVSLKMSTQMGSVDGPKWSGIPATQPWAQETQGDDDNLLLNVLNDIKNILILINILVYFFSSDWNAPVEHWGNYEEPSAVEPPVFSLKEQADPSDAAKSKKRRRKKKKTEEETASQARNSNIK